MMQMCKLGDIAEIITGSTPSKTLEAYWQNGCIPFITPAELSEYVEFAREPEDYITHEGLEKARLIPKNAVLVCCIGSLGKLGIAPRELVTNQQINSVVFDEKKVYYRYGAYALSRVKPEMERLSAATTVSIINKSSFSNIKIPVPPLSIQRRIADTLDKVQELIDKRKQQIELLDEFLQSVFLDMFGDPGANPKGWVVDKLGCHTSLVSSGSTPRGGSKVYTSQGIPLIRSQNVLMNQLSYEDVAFISKEIHEQMRRSQVRANDVLLNITGASIGRVALYKGEDCKANVNQHVCIIRLKESLVPEYVAYFISTPYMQARIQRQNAGATRQALNYSQIKDFDIVIPPLEQQKRFAQIYGMVEEKKDVMMLSLSKLKKMFNSIMQRVFRGELFG